MNIENICHSFVIWSFFLCFDQREKKKIKEECAGIWGQADVERLLSPYVWLETE